MSDEEILAVIKRGSNLRLSQIVAQSDGMKERQVDRALQRLRKAGKIVYMRTGWHGL